MLNVELPQNGYETLGGFIYNVLGHVPQIDENLEHGNLLIEILEVVGQRITRVKITKRGEPSQDEPKHGGEIQMQNDKPQK